MPRRLIVHLIAVLALAVTANAQSTAEQARAIYSRAVTDFLNGRITSSVDGFDEVARLAPAEAPQLWQRGIAQYYAGRYRDCRAQFESHRTLNPADRTDARRSNDAGAPARRIGFGEPVAGLSGSLPAIESPTLVIQGLQDEYGPSRQVKAVGVWPDKASR